MYERFFGLHERPFDLTPDPRYLFLTPKHQEALTNLQYGIAQRKGVTAVLGPAGTGKTTLVRTALAALAEAGGRCLNVNNPALTRDEFIQMMARGFDLSAEAGESKTTMLAELEVRLHEYHAAGTATALVIDEAQALSDELLEEVRLLVNLETDTDKLLPIVLAGQEELSERLAQPSCAALKQRIALRCHLLAAHGAGDGTVHRHPPADCRRRSRRRVHARRHRRDSPAIGRHSAHDQRALRQLADVRLRRRSAACRSAAGPRSVPGFRLRNAVGAPGPARHCAEACRRGSVEARGPRQRPRRRMLRFSASVRPRPRRRGTRRTSDCSPHLAAPRGRGFRDEDA